MENKYFVLYAINSFTFNEADVVAFVHASKRKVAR